MLFHLSKIYIIFNAYCLKDLLAIFIVIFIEGFCIVIENLSYIGEFFGVIIMFYLQMLFYGTCVWEVVCKATVECRGCVANVGNNFKVVFLEVLSKWACKFINYISLIKESFRDVFVILNYDIWRA